MVCYKCIKRIFKFLPLFIFLFIISFFVFTSTSYCDTFNTFSYDNNIYYTYFNFDMLSFLQNFSEYSSGNYNYVVLGTGMGYELVQFIPKSYSFSVYMANSSGQDYNWTISTSGNSTYPLRFVCESNVDCTVYRVGSASHIITNTFTNAVLSYGNDVKFIKENENCYFLSSVPIYTDSSLNNYFYNPSPAFINPEFLNAEDSHWSNTLENGEFNYFFIDCNDAEYVSFTVQDLTLLSQNYNIDYNSFTQTFNLWETNYIYNTDLRQYAIPKTDLMNGFYNNHEYKYTLSWTVDNVSDSKTWTITTDFSQTTLTNDAEIQKNNMEQDLSSINNFLSDSSYDASIYGGLPSLDLPDNIPVEQYIDSLFEYLREAFTSEESIDFRFYVPFSNGTYITVPSNYIEQHLPIEIINIIRTFYWFCIGMYIFKYFWHLIDSIRQGDFFTASERDIKTEVL